MFSRDMPEKDSNYINIEDLSNDTGCRMLLCICITHVKDLTRESASHLYVTADKCAILSLKKCMLLFFLQENLSPSNACEVLLVSDFHVHGDLKSAAQDYTVNHGKEVTLLT
ncbi:hypothetical protein AVEN_133699-1 [Araneus ventricosus]|uniref:Uncharacterized protein n=1 Tax=Araneus ventricosus TaxID=182803 RepID=A0A4Y2B7J6_ARAVE|nr:hypothetical protein AVEN_133699-1 [Araneus ventricosus]